MSDLSLILNDSALHRLGWGLIHSVWQGAVGAVLFWGLRMGLRRRSADTRYLAACVMLALVAAAPVITMTVQSSSLPSWPLEPAGTGAAWVRPAPVSGAVGGWESGGRIGAGQGPAPAVERVLPWLVLAWLLGVAAFLCRWVWGSWWLRRVQRVGTGPLDSCWLERLAEMKQRLGVSQPVRLLRSALVEVPMVTGWLRPIILLPASTLTGLTPAQLDAILAHELAHIRRLDYVVNACQNLVETLMFYHPAVWWISHCIREERELCCDDLVVRACGDRVNYARALYLVETLRPTPRLAFAATGGSLLCRIRRLLGAGGDTRPAGAREVAGLALAGIGCMLLVGGGLLMLRPAMYQAAVLIKLDSESSRLAPPNPNQPARVYYDPYFVQTELAVIRSPAILKRVSLAPQPPQAPGSSLQDRASLLRLRSRLAIRQVPGTTLVEIVASDEDAATAARLANAVAAAYEEFRAGQWRGVVQESRKQLQAGIVLVTGQIAEAEKKLDQLRVDLGIPVSTDEALSSNQGAAPVLLTAETLRRLETLRIEQQAQLARERTLLEALKNLKPEELSQAILTAMPDTILNSLLEQLNSAEQKLVTLSREYGPEHPERVKAAAQVDDLKSKIQQRTAGVMIGLTAKVQSMENGLEQLGKAVEEAMLKDRELASRLGPYREAKQHLQELKPVREALVQKAALERADFEYSSLPGLIVERAVAPQKRTNPDREPAVMLMAAGLLVLLVGIWLGRSNPGTPLTAAPAHAS